MFFEMGNVLNVLLKSQQINNQYKRTALLFPFTHHREKRF